MYHIGVDIGSTYTKYCFMDHGHRIIDLAIEKTPIRQKEYFQQKKKILADRFPGAGIVSCGYGRTNIESFKDVNELTALAQGGNFVYPAIDTILDIGGQDAKLIHHEAGKLKEFSINEKCAAGSGMFLSNVSHMLGVDLHMIDLTCRRDQGIKLPTTCAVFAQSEVIKLLASNTPVEAILQAVLSQIFIQARTLVSKAKTSAVILSGGLTQIKGIESFAEEILGMGCHVPREGAYLSAIGCSLLCDGSWSGT